MIDKKSSFRVLKDEKKSAYENMAIDDSLLSCFKKDDLGIFRLYNWDESFTIGISQDFSMYSFSSTFEGNYAKRITGGGVLFHGHDLSYSLVIPTELLNGYNIKQSYEKICYFIINFYKKLGLKTCFAKDDEAITLSKNEYCQVGFEAYDILVNGQKIGGNAQRRTKKAIFQHGSIPIYSVKNSNMDKQKFGVSLEELDIKISYEEAMNLLIKSFKESFDVDLIVSKLNEQELEKKEELLKEKYDYSKQ